MTYRGWAFLACRLLAIYFLFALIFQLLPTVYSMIVYAGKTVSYSIPLFMFAALALVIFFLWRWAPWLAEKMAPEQRPGMAEARIEIDVHSLAAIAIGILGLLIVIGTVPGFVSLVVSLLQGSHNASALIIAPLIRLLIGLFFIFKSRKLAAFLMKAGT